jgi:hypothetical protein
MKIGSVVSKIFSIIRFFGFWWSRFYGQVLGHLTQSFLKISTWKFLVWNLLCYANFEKLNFI